MQRHLRDVVNSSINNSIVENGCKEMHLVVVNVLGGSAVGLATEVPREKVKTVCDALLNETLKNVNCTSAKTSAQWMKDRLEVAVSEVAGLLHKSLTDLLAAELVVKEAFGDVVNGIREALCMENHRIERAGESLNEAEKQAASVAERATYVHRTVVSTAAKVSETLGKSKEAMKNALKAEELTSNSLIETGATKRAHDASVSSAESVIMANKSCESLVQSLTAKRIQMTTSKNKLEAVLQGRKNAFNEQKQKFFGALNVTSWEQFSTNEGICNGRGFDVPALSVSATFDAILKLQDIPAFCDNVEMNKSLQVCEEEMSAMVKLSTELDAQSKWVNESATSATASARAAWENSLNATRSAVKFVRNKIKEKRDALCQQKQQLVAFDADINLMQRQKEELSGNVSGSVLAARKVLSAAREAFKKCSGALQVHAEAARVAWPANTMRAIEGDTPNCTESFANVSLVIKKVEEAAVAANKTLMQTGEKHLQLGSLLSKGKANFSTTETRFAQMLEGVDSWKRVPSQSLCDASELDLGAITFENLTFVTERLNEMELFSLSGVNVGVRNYRALMGEAAADANAVTERAKQAEVSAKSTEQAAEEAEERAKAALKRALAKQQGDICEAVKRLRELNRNTTVLVGRAKAMRESASVFNKQAAAARKNAEEAAARAAAAEAYAAVAVREHAKTYSVVKDVTKSLRLVEKSPVAGVVWNEQRIQKISSFFNDALQNVSNSQCQKVTNVCAAATGCDITLPLDESLAQVNALTSLANITSERNAFARLALSDRSIAGLLEEAGKRMSTTQAAAAAALRIAEDAKCTPMYLQMFHIMQRLL
ncbi:hypothetical protein ERJ75_000873800 [Trypanosoma vivax]|uniref:Uncharacterized protein n=1 Tax=Trypanosoma vivax (strain Y486) TaxID=1055687 RepID=F9WM21_TRYVY|nr:hypothetical protein ERJ75_000873800 [Trypanosoma vivax]CCD18571.1 hypothetical protein, conserved in T. vivax [Trypanosoma vivax Y486]|eukprot:CCD18571.1 hypothetical protein, conserved in T. vivax [Trypanosoma vivax Y486]